MSFFTSLLIMYYSWDFVIMSSPQIDQLLTQRYSLLKEMSTLSHLIHGFMV